MIAFLAKRRFNFVDGLCHCAIAILAFSGLYVSAITVVLLGPIISVKLEQMARKGEGE